MNAIFFQNKHHRKKALYANTAYEVVKKMNFSQFVEKMKSSTTIVPYAPRKHKISYGLLGTKTQPTNTTFDTSNRALDGNFTRSKEHIQDKTYLLVIDIDVHLLLDVYGKLKGLPHPAIAHLPTEDTVFAFFAGLGLDLTKLNHLIYKSTSYGRLIEYDKGSYTKTNMHIWFELKTMMNPEEQASFVAALFSPLDDLLPQKLKGLNRQLKVRTAPSAPDMSVYSAARLLIQGDLTDRIISTNTKGRSITKSFIAKTLTYAKKHPVEQQDLYTPEELREMTDDAASYNLVNNTNLTASDFAKDTKRTGRTLQTGELYRSDPVYFNNKLWGTFGSLREAMEKEARQELGDALFVEDKDVTTNISDILDPVNGGVNNCYVVLKPDGSMYVYHYSESRWFIVLNRDAEEDAETIEIEKYLPTEKIEDIFDNHCIIAPTGTGKTYHVISKVLSLLRKNILHKVVWTVPDYAALQSIEAEVKSLGTEGVKFKAIHAGVDKFDAFEQHNFVICTMSKLHGELHSRTQNKQTFNHSRIDFAKMGEESKKEPYDTSKWSFVLDEVHTLFTHHSSVEAFMYYRILQRELHFDRLLVMSASITPELLPGYHDRAWLPTSADPGEWVVDSYNLKKPRMVKVTTQFPWEEILSPQTDSALIMSATALKAVGVYEELLKVHKEKTILLYIGLPRNATEMSIQKYPYYKEDGTVDYKEYTRPTNEELNKADFVVATALTAGTSLSRAYDFCVVDMQGIPAPLEVRSVEVQKISRARHPDVQRTLVISGTRFKRGDDLNLSPQPLRTTTHPMESMDYESSKRLALNKHRTEVLSTELKGGEESRKTAEAMQTKEETPTFVREHILTFDTPSVKHQIEETLLARFDVFKAASVYYKAKDKYVAFNRDSYEGPWGGGLTSYMEETKDIESDLSLGKEHSLSVREYKDRIKDMSKSEFDIFMSTPPVGKAMDRAQQDIRKIEVPETPTCDPSVGLLPTEYILHPEKVKRFMWNPDFFQAMHQDVGLAQQALRQNNILCSASYLYIQEMLQEDTFYPVTKALALLHDYIKHKETKAAILKIKKNPLSYLRKIGRITLYEGPSITRNRVVTPPEQKLVGGFTEIPSRSRKEKTHFRFKLGWFSIDDSNYIIEETSVKAPLLSENPTFLGS